ncbi:MAG: alpha/beta hydrolase [Pseudonocardiales bacterium]|nr:alpha/beta hydrolase [Pseudonocardiales bacterium]MBV9029325.1 alpha/beta hydrolase [Pseudonocardiales bacterium]
MARTDPAVRRTAEELSRPGPHAVARGDLTAAGIPGVVFTPRSGHGLPAVAFGHGWLQPTTRYEELLRHLATWGVVVAAPATQRGALASHRQFAGDLRTVLDVCVGVRLGDGEISVDPGRLGLVGHGMGGGCAVLAAAADDRCRAVATLALAETLPSAVAAARGCTMPGLHVVGGKDLLAPALGHAEPVARAWAGPVRLRTLPKAGHLGFTMGPHWTDVLLGSGPETGTRRMSRALVTAFLLLHLTGATGTEATDYDALLTEPH